MTPADLPQVHRVSEIVHPSFPEAPEVFAERCALAPEGCHVLVGPERQLGYMVAHPWTRGLPPGLDTLIGAIPADADVFYIHDLALVPAARGTGAAAAIVRHVVAMSDRAGFPEMTLISVNDTTRFWGRFGFVVDSDPLYTERLLSYSADARFMSRSASAR